MIKKLLPTMIGAALVGGMAPAVADVTVFGHIDTSIDYVDQNNSDTNMNCNTCSIGFKGSEDLGNGLKAIFKIDFQYDTTERNTGRARARSASQQINTVTVTTTTDTGGNVNVNPNYNVTTVSGVTSVSDTSSITDRDQWLGLAGNFGQVRFGTISTVYKSHGAMIDPIYRTSAQARSVRLQSNLHNGAGENGEGRAEDTIRYDSPNWNGLQFGAHYTIQTDPQPDGSDTDSPWGAGIQYQNGPFLVFADYITNDNGGDDEAAKIGGKWTIGNYSLYGQYEYDMGLISYLDGAQSGNKGDGNDVWEIGGTATFGNNTLVAAYGQNDGTSGGNGLNNESDQFEIVGVHSLSKRTLVYGGYVNISPDKGSDADIVTVGMKHKF
jgi:predicted porin